MLPISPSAKNLGKLRSESKLAHKAVASRRLQIEFYLTKSQKAPTEAPILPRLRPRFLPTLTNAFVLPKNPQPCSKKEIQSPN